MDLLALSKTIADRVEIAASRAAVPVAVCVVDTHGNVILKHRMSGASAFSIELSERKSLYSALVGMRTTDLLPLVQPGQNTPPADDGWWWSLLRNGRRRACQTQKANA